MNDDHKSQEPQETSTGSGSAQESDQENRIDKDSDHPARTGETRQYQPKLRTKPRAPTPSRQPVSPRPGIKNGPPPDNIVPPPPSDPEVATKNLTGDKQESPKVTPESASAFKPESASKASDSGFKPEAARPSGTPLPRVKHRATAMPPSALEHMEKQTKDGHDRAKPKMAKRIFGAGLLAGVAALALALAALAVAWLPRWRHVSVPRDLLDHDLSVIIAFGVLLALALLLRHRIGKTPAFILLAFQTVLLAALLLTGYWPDQALVRLMQYELLDFLAGVNLLAAATLLSLAAIFLSVLPAQVRTVTAVVVTVVALAVSWLPPETLPLPVSVPSGFPRAMLAENQWQIAERKPIETVWRHQQRAEDRCAVRLLLSEDDLEKSFGRGEAYLQDEWGGSGVGLLSMIPWRDRPHQRRYVNFSAERVVDALIIAGESTTDISYLVVFEADPAEYAELQSFIGEVFQAIQP